MFLCPSPVIVVIRFVSLSCIFPLIVYVFRNCIMHFDINSSLGLRQKLLSYSFKGLNNHSLYLRTIRQTHTSFFLSVIKYGGTSWPLYIRGIFVSMSYFNFLIWHQNKVNYDLSIV
jgi:hypothetical protein